MLTISIITTGHNGAATICDCIEGMQRQFYPRERIEHIVIDGGSIDGTMEVIDAYRKRVSQVVPERDNGIYDALNKRIEVASTGVIVCRYRYNIHALRLIS